MNIINQLLLACMYAGLLFVGLLLAAFSVWILYRITVDYRESQKRFSLNPEWDATRDFIDAIPTKKK